MSMKSRYTLASRLAKFLRLNGDKVIDGSCKLSLTTSALCLVNSLFIDVLNQSGDHELLLRDVSNEELLTDVQFLYDFIKKTTSLKLFHGTQTLRGGVDLSYFSNLVALELRKIPAHLIIGLDTLSQQLKALICTRSIYLLKELFGNCINDAGSVTVWSELNELNLAHNYLEILDSSMKCFPNLQVLDLSHNNIKHVDEIHVLSNLAVVNLSYNQLDHLPYFNTMSCRSLRKLYLRNNNLEDLEGLDCMFCLEELDLSFNCLSDYSVLNPLDKLKNLKVMKLEGNPLFFHKCHREIIARYFHSTILNEGIILDGKLLISLIKFNPEPTPLENVIGTENHSRHQTAINMVVEDIHNAIHDESKSVQSSDLDKIIFPKTSTPRGDSIKVKGNLRKKSKMREALINEPTERNNEDNDDVFEPLQDIGARLPSHFGAKLDIEAKRRQQGEAWLIPENSLVSIQLPKVPYNTPVSSSYQEEPALHQLSTQSELVDECLDLVNLQQEVISESTTSAKEETRADCLGLENSRSLIETRHSSKSSDDIEILIPVIDSDLTSKIESYNQDDLYDVDVYEKSVSESSSDAEFSEAEESEEESESQIFIADRVNKSQVQTLFVNIGPKYIKERHLLTGKVLEKLNLSRLSSVDIINKEDESKSEVHVTFDTVKPSNKERIYVLDNPEAAKNMISILKPFADAKTLEEATIGALECLNCNSQFSKDVAHRKVFKTKISVPGQDTLSSSLESSKDFPEEANVCPNCGSKFVLEIDTFPVPALLVRSVPSPNIPLKNRAHESAQEGSSVGSSSSGSFLAALFSSTKKTPMLNRKDDVSGTIPLSQENVLSKPCEENVSFSEKNIVSTNTGTDSVSLSLRRNSSDITVTSNPSQSSIAVIPEIGVENELNTIIEKSSQYSLSPPPSEVNMILTPEMTGIRNQDAILSNLQQDAMNGNFLPTSINQNQSSVHQDSHSLDDSFEQSTEDYLSDSVSPYLSTAAISGDAKSLGSENEEIADESVQLLNLLSQKEVINNESFTHLDHRLKLHLEISVFEDDENFDICLQTSIIPLSTGDEFNGLFVLSSVKVYVVKILQSNSEDVSKTVQVVHSSPLNQMKNMQLIYGNQGFQLSCGSRNLVFTVLVRDADLCNSLVALITAKIQSKSSKESKAAIVPTNQFQQLKEELINSYHTDPSLESKEPEILLYLFGYWKDVNKNEEPINPVCIVVTSTEIFASKVLYKKQDSSKDWQNKPLFHYVPVGCQKISDLLSLELEASLTAIKLCFHDEENENESQWLIYTQTKTSMFSLVSSLKNPWESIFGITLPLMSGKS